MGSRYQAEVPELRQRSEVELDRHGAELVWVPPAQLEEKPEYQQKGEGSSGRASEARPDRDLNVLFMLSVDRLMHLACSSVFYGGGTNQELAHHCLHQCQGDIMVSTALHTAPFNVPWLQSGPPSISGSLWISGSAGGDFRPRRPVLVQRCQGNHIQGGVKRPHSCSSSVPVFQNAQTASSAKNTRVC